MNKYKIEHLENDTYQILENTNYESNNWYNPAYPNMFPLNEKWEVVFQGTLPECDAFINLKEKGYM